MIKKLFNESLDKFKLTSNQNQIKADSLFLLSAYIQSYDITEDLDSIDGWKDIAENSSTSKTYIASYKEREGFGGGNFDISTEFSAEILCNKIKQIDLNSKIKILSDESIFSDDEKFNPKTINELSREDRKLYLMVISFVSHMNMYSGTMCSPTISNMFLNNVRFELIKDLPFDRYSDFFCKCYLSFLATSLMLHFRHMQEYKFLDLLKQNKKWIDLGNLIFNEYYGDFENIKKLAHFASYECCVYLILKLIEKAEKSINIQVLERYLEFKKNKFQFDYNNAVDLSLIGFLVVEKEIIKGVHDRWVTEQMFKKYLLDILTAYNPEKINDISEFVNSYDFNE